MAERASLVTEEAIEQLAAEQGPRWPSRKAAWRDGFRHGEQHARMTGADRRDLLNAFKERLLSDEAARAAVRVNHPLWNTYDPQTRRNLSNEMKRSFQAALSTLEASDGE